MWIAYVSLLNAPYCIESNNQLLLYSYDVHGDIRKDAVTAYTLHTGVLQRASYQYHQSMRRSLHYMSIGCGDSSLYKLPVKTSLLYVHYSDSRDCQSNWSTQVRERQWLSRSSMIITGRKLAVVTYKTGTTSTLTYLSHLIHDYNNPGRCLRSPDKL